MQDTEQTRSSRERMVDWQIGRRGILNPRVLVAMRTVPRHLFVDESLRGEAYADHPLPIGHGQTISQPYIVALMTSLLDIKPEDNILDVGTGCGYQAAVLAKLSPHVTSIEMVPELVALARNNLLRAGTTGVEVVEGDGSLGYPQKAPYDAILVAACAPIAPPPLLDQLAPNGRMVIPVEYNGEQRIEVWQVDAAGEDAECTRDIAVAFVPLLGQWGYHR